MAIGNNGEVVLGINRFPSWEAQPQASLGPRKQRGSGDPERYHSIKRYQSIDNVRPVDYVYEKTLLFRKKP